MAAMLKQTGAGAKAYPRRSLCAGELHASWLAAEKFCEGHKARPYHQSSESPSLPTLPYRAVKATAVRAAWQLHVPAANQ